MELGEQAAYAVAGAGALGGEVLVEAHEHGRFGDAFGDRWFGILRREGPAALEARILPPEPLWQWSDDTAQALVLVRELAEGGGSVDQDRLALRLAEAYADDTHRGYGASMHDVLRRIGGRGLAGGGRRSVRRPGLLGQRLRHARGPARSLARRRPRCRCRAGRPAE
ncbi:hypothetical protein Slala03_78400 [Streptomyces lavendulae subsp. lavendulae]|nr:hypothetical protein Slala03_78400 [Streptomyces lavendulae subsp. lavendulae]